MSFIDQCWFWAKLWDVIIDVWYEIVVFKVIPWSSNDALVFSYSYFSQASPYEFIEFAKLALLGFLQSSLAAARADNFYYPPEWTPNQVCFSSSCYITLLK